MSAKWLRKILLFAVSAGAGLFVSLLVTLVPWNFYVESRGFHCTDDVGFGTFLENMDTHRSAGDTVLPGWTWEKLDLVETAYRIAFFAIWFGSTALFLSSARKANRALAAPVNTALGTPPNPVAAQRASPTDREIS